MRLVNLTRSTLLADKVRVAANFWSRLRGLMGRREMDPGEALVLEGCRAIHTCFMRLNIDVAFLDEGGRVLKTLMNLPPCRFTMPVPGACRVVELPAGVLLATGTVTGDRLVFLDVFSAASGE
ncbi:DUF192 domain-containing protein [Desulfofundulus sp.]|uniref:DUF192 domain-containing protein n=1 Tax=Desulfofundulus sp. TaxID=2282750 RepID=UPI003C78DD77